jgi:Tfp pilus assembly protein PilP
VRFPEASVESLRLVALLRKQGQSVGLVSDGARYENLRKGDFLGREQVEVLSITERGILLRQSDGLERLMKFNQRS